MARTGSGFTNTISFLDQVTIGPGITPTAYLHGMNLLNGTHEIPGQEEERGRQRWAIHTNSFITGLPNYHHATNVKLDFNLWAPENSMHLLNGLPHIAEKVFYLEAKTWLGYGTGAHGNKYKPTQPGHCPGRIKNSADTEMIAVHINLGVEHLDKSHSGQALQCWSDAIVALTELQAKKRANPSGFHIEGRLNIEEMLDIAKGNAKSYQLMRYVDYVINENHNTEDFLEYSSRFQNVEYEDFVRSQGGEGGGGRRGGGGRYGDRGDEDEFNMRGMKSLDDILDDIAKLEMKLVKLKDVRDKMLEFSAAQAPV